MNTARDPLAPPDRCVLLVPRSDYRIVDTWRVAGLKATGSHDLVVEDVFVPAHRLLPFVDAFRGAAPGLEADTAPLYRLPFGQIFVRGVSTAALGALQGMLDAFLRYGAARVGRGGRTADDPVAQLAVAETAAAIDEMKTILMRDFATLMDYAQRGELPPFPLRMEYKLHSPWWRSAAAISPPACSGRPAASGSTTISPSAASSPTSMPAASTSPTSSSRSAAPTRLSSSAPSRPRT